MPEISLTDFVDYVAKSGGPRLTHVKALKKRGQYDPAQDFWRGLRKAIIEYHEKGHTNKGWLDGVTAALTDTKKKNNYPNAIASYKTFLGKKGITWFKPHRTLWQHGGLDIRTNPELGLVINGVRHHVKLYFKGAPIRKDKADMILLLLQQGLPKTKAGDRFALLDVQAAKLFSADSPDQDLLPLLHGEATSFAAIWNALPGNGLRVQPLD